MESSVQGTTIRVLLRASPIYHTLSYDDPRPWVELVLCCPEGCDQTSLLHRNMSCSWMKSHGTLPPQPRDCL